MEKRKPTRLKEYDYSVPGAYFVTVCTKDRKELLSRITVGDDVLIVPQNHLSDYGLICDKYIKNMNVIYENVSVDKYIIMPNHIHLLMTIHGTMPSSSPTKNIGSIIRSFKTMVTREIGSSIFQRSYHDHIVRNHEDYLSIWQYIEENAAKWQSDRYFIQRKLKRYRTPIKGILYLLELMSGLEPPTYALPRRCATNCATSANFLRDLFYHKAKKL